jgi:hypothetical protein
MAVSAEEAYFFDLRGFTVSLPGTLAWYYRSSTLSQIHFKTYLVPTITS